MLICLLPALLACCLPWSGGMPQQACPCLLACLLASLARAHQRHICLRRAQHCRHVVLLSAAQPALCSAVCSLHTVATLLPEFPCAAGVRACRADGCCASHLAAARRASDKLHHSNHICMACLAGIIHTCIRSSSSSAAVHAASDHQYTCADITLHSTSWPD